MAIEFADRRPDFWTVRVGLVGGEQVTLREGRTGRNEVRIRQVIHETVAFRRRARWGEHDDGSGASWPEKLGISLIGLVVLNILTEGVLPNAGLEGLAWPAWLLFLVWMGALWTGGGRLKGPA